MPRITLGYWGRAQCSLRSYGLISCWPLPWAFSERALSQIWGLSKRWERIALGDSFSCWWWGKLWWQKAHFLILIKLICRLSFSCQSYQNKSRGKKPEWFYDAFLLFSIPVWFFTEYCNQTKENGYASVSEMRRGAGFDKIWVSDKMTSKAAVSIWI